MGYLIFLIFYGSILFFIIATAIRIKKCLNAPIHLNWELYKGSSIYELPEWWKKTKNPFSKKLWSMILDILLLREYYHRNRGFWYPLFLFHMGIYSLFLWHIWLFIYPILKNIESNTIAGWFWGTISTIISLIGSFVILYLRLNKEELKIYYPPIHYLKWIFVILTLFGGIYAVDIHFKSNMPEILKYVREQVTFTDIEKKLHPSFGPALHILFCSVWLIYLPFSHIYKLFFRYYHYLRWDEVPIVKGNEIEIRVKKNLERPVNWSAPHIQSGKMWKEVTSEFK